MKMKTNTLFAGLLLLVFFAGTITAVQNGQKVHILVTYGGHDFQEEAFWKMFNELPGISYSRAKLPDDADLLTPGLEQKFDAVVMYDMVTAFTESQQKAFIELLKTGIGVVSLHHNLGAHRDWLEFSKIIGGKYVFSPRILGGKEHGLSTFAHDQDMNIKILDPDHPITRGIADFQIHDECYGNYFTSPGAKVLLSTDHPKNDREIAWVTRYGNSSVCYLLLGHDARAWAHPAFQKLLLNAVDWVARNTARSDME